MASALTIATRCFCPPESWIGYAFARSASPTRSRSSRAFFSASALETPLTFIGASVILSRIVMCGNRLKCWNTIPIFCLRASISSLTFLPEASLYLFLVISTPLKMISPSVGSSRRFRLRRKVDLPEPEGPMTTITSPLLIFTVTSSSALIAPL